MDEKGLDFTHEVWIDLWKDIQEVEITLDKLGFGLLEGLENLEA